MLKALLSGILSSFGDQQGVSRPIYDTAYLTVESQAYQMTEGLFGQGLTWLWEVARNLDFAGYKPGYVDFSNVTTMRYGNLVPHIVKTTQPLFAGHAASKRINLMQVKHWQHAQCTQGTLAHWYSAHRIWSRWFRPSADAISLVIDVPSYTLGLHYRGTDKQHDKTQATSISMQEMISVVKWHTLRYRYEHVLAVSDESSFISQLSQNLPSNVTVHGRSAQPITTSGSLDGNLALADVISLSRCNEVIKTSSALSAWVQIIQPETPVYTLSAMRQAWFPAAAVQPYTPNTPEQYALLKRTMKGHSPWACHG